MDGTTSMFDIKRNSVFSIFIDKLKDSWPKVKRFTKFKLFWPRG
jgi:hypothetical protein